jgi:hypothetical protein
VDNHLIKPSLAATDDKKLNSNEEEEDVNESIDREIMQDLDEYRREEEIKRLKDLDDVDENGEPNNLLASPSSPRMRAYLDSDGLEGIRGDRFNGRQSGTQSQDSLRKANKGESPDGLPELIPDDEKGLQIHKLNSSKIKKKEKKENSPSKKKNKRHMQERIANILVDIDKSIYEINR